MDKFVYGADTETIRGKPMTLQFYSEDTACDDLFFVNENTARDTFLRWCSQRKKNVQHVVYVHNLAFDLVEFLWGDHAKLATGEFDFKCGKARVSGVYGTPTFCRIQFGNGVSTLLVDSFSYFRESLAKAAIRVCPDLPKLRRIVGIGEKLFTKKDQDFCAYAMRDAVVAYHLGKAIEALHHEFDVTQCVSVADMAARVFKRKFLDYTIPQPPRDVIERALLSYHGGKNNVTVPAGWYEGVGSLDISSAFPESMHAMPSFAHEKLYKLFRSASNVRDVPAYGVYCVTGTVDNCKWPSVFSHSFKPLHGRIDRVWMQGFELYEAISSGELKLTARLTGHYYDSERDNQAPALRAYVDYFYERKESAKSATQRFMYKLLLNSLYGKFIQTRKRGTCAYTDVDSGDTTTAADLVAGGMFHPLIASAITAKPRARIHRLEHQYEALHTATDGIFTQKPIRRGSNFDTQPGAQTRLGSLTVEAESATLLLLRNKTYVLYTDEGPKTVPSQVFEGRHIRKFALHGFQGNVTDLEKLAASGRRTYTVKRANRLKESIKRGLVPNDFVTRQFTLRVGPLSVHEAQGSRERQARVPRQSQRQARKRAGRQST